MLAPLLFSALLASLPASAAGENCSVSLEATGLCGTIEDGTHLDISDTVNIPGDDDSPGTPPVYTTDPVPTSPPPPTPYELLEDCLTRWDFAACYRSIDPADPADPAPADPGTPAIILTDLARFLPADTTLTGEPSNLGVVGLPTNLITHATTTIVPGELFGRALRVEFTPTRFHLDHGDGTTASVPTGGTSWEHLHVPQFTPTDTSHTYLQRGTYTVTATVDYTVRIDLGTGWIPLDGTLTGPPATQSIRIYQARTALVDRSCTQDPDGIGC